MTLSNSTVQYQADDAAHHLHPFTNTRELNTRGVRVIKSAKGSYLTDNDGNRLLDGMAGLWCTSVGFGRKEIIDAVAKQMEELTYYNTFFNTTHPPIIELSKLLVEVTPPQFNRFFYTGSGSESNDTIMRLVSYYWDLMEQPQRKVFVSRRGAYHGSTVASAALGGFDAMHSQPGLPVGNIFHAPPPSWWDEGGDLSREEFGLKVAADTLALIDGIGVNKVAAFIGEPIQGAGGVIIPPETYWPTLVPGLKERGVLFISDEVICGFGRTGNWFGCETMGTEPDIMTMAKGLTSGYIPMGGVAVADHVADVLLEKGGEFAHGYTYSGHPAACAAAIATLNIMKNEKLVERVRDDIGPYLQNKWRSLADHPLVGEATMTGMMGSIQLTPNKASRAAFPKDSNVGTITRELSVENGLIMRAVGDRMIVSPPLILTHAEADELIEKTTIALDATLPIIRKKGLIS